MGAADPDWQPGGDRQNQSVVWEVNLLQGLRGECRILSSILFNYAQLDYIVINSASKTHYAIISEMECENNENVWVET